MILDWHEGGSHCTLYTLLKKKIQGLAVVLNALHVAILHTGLTSFFISFVLSLQIFSFPIKKFLLTLYKILFFLAGSWVISEQIQWGKILQFPIPFSPSQTGFSSSCLCSLKLFVFLIPAQFSLHICVQYTTKETEINIMISPDNLVYPPKHTVDCTQHSALHSIV